MGSLTFIFLTFFALYLGLSLWLDLRQARFVRAHREAVPPAFAGKVSLEEHQKAADYTGEKLRVGMLDLVLSGALLLAWTLGGGLASLDALVTRAALPELIHGAAMIVLVMLVPGLIFLPLSIYRTFGIEKKYGFNRTTLATFIGDRLKGLVLALLIGAPFALLALWLMKESGVLWWLWLWVALTLFMFLMMWAAPVLIMPLFNKFTPLSDDALRERIERLLSRCGFSARGVFVMDGSKRSSHGNAFFTGLGRAKRIVFFDTLLSTLEPVEVEAVLAHELGHFRKRHNQKRLVVSTLASLAMTAVLGWLASWPGFYHQLGVATPSNHAALILFTLVWPVFTFIFGPIVSLFSRKKEYEADEFAASNSDASALARALVKLHKDNASTLTPDPIYSAFYYSHPPALERIRALEAAPAAA